MDLKIFNKKSAFTLAEVLITLGIIGVVSAMTIPTLIANTNSSRYNSQYKKTLSTVAQGVKMNAAKYGWDLGNISAISDHCTMEGDPETQANICVLFNSSIRGNWIDDRTIFSSQNSNRISYNMVTTSNDFYNDCGNNTGSIFQFSDGALLYICSSEGNCTKQNPCFGYIDVNGMTSPNTETRCANDEETYTFWGQSTSEEGESVTIQRDFNACDVDRKSVYDVFPIMYYDQVVTPATNAAAGSLRRGNKLESM